MQYSMVLKFEVNTELSHAIRGYVPYFYIQLNMKEC